MGKACRIAVTGLGVVTPLGSSPGELWGNLMEGRSGIRDIALFDTSEFNTSRAGQLAKAPKVETMNGDDGRGFSRGSILAAEAAKMALLESGVPAYASKKRGDIRLGLCLGSAMGDLSALEELNRRGETGDGGAMSYMSPSRTPYNNSVRDVASLLGVSGPVSAVSAACASGNYALAQGVDLIRGGAADLVLAGGAEPLSRILLATLTRYGGQLDGVCRPFDIDRKGTVLAEGAGILALEDMERARARGVPILAEILGYGLSSDAYHMTAPDPEGAGAALAMERALYDAGLSPEEIDYINAHGTGTPLNDKAETRAIKEVFGKAAYGLPVSSTKSMLGHSMGAASAIEAAICCIALGEGAIPPTINYASPDPECDLDYVPNRPRKKALKIVASNAFGIGGSNSTLILGKPA